MPPFVIITPHIECLPMSVPSLDTHYLNLTTVLEGEKLVNLHLAGELRGGEGTYLKEMAVSGVLNCGWAGSYSLAL